MKILLTANKTYRGTLDGSWWHFYMPLINLGHDIYFYDTVYGETLSYDKIIESFKPDLIFCIMTGDAGIAPMEPWRHISRETETGRTKTFNWFCDDTWRFDSFSKNVCSLFNCFSTTEREYLLKFREHGFSNALLTNWHISSDFFKIKPFEEKNIDISFIGNLTGTRGRFFSSIGTEVKAISGVSHGEFIEAHQDTKIGINLAANDNDPFLKTQMKQRVFEIPAANSLLMTQYHEGIEEYFDINKEIVTFKSLKEFDEKAKYLLKNMKISEKIAQNGYKRFLKEHTSESRLHKLLKDIEKI